MVLCAPYSTFSPKSPVSFLKRSFGKNYGNIFRRKSPLKKCRLTSRGKKVPVTCDRTGGCLENLIHISTNEYFGYRT